jgi:DNA-binding transcriptional MerR regulator
MDGCFPTPVAAKLAGLPPTTLHQWAKRGFLRPSIPRSPPKPSLYSFRDLVALRVLADLCARGIEIHCLTRVVAYLRKRKGLELTTSQLLASMLLVTDGHDVYEVDGLIGISTLRDPDQTVMLVPFGRMVAKLQAAALKLAAA